MIKISERFNRIGTTSFRDPNNHEKDISVFVYKLDNKIYLYPQSCYIYNFETRELKTFELPENLQNVILDEKYKKLSEEENEKILPRILKLAAADEETAKLRKEKSLEFAQGDEVLACAIHFNIKYNNGYLDEPLVIEGIPFYRVGHNASHDFYMGYKDGQRYRYSIGSDHKDPKPVAVDEFNGYYGHY